MICTTQPKAATWTVLLWAMATLGFSQLAVADAGTLYLQKRVPFEKGISVPDAVRAECNLETKIPAYVREAVSGQFKIVDAEGGRGKTLTMKITGVLGVGGGAWSGPKSVTVEGTLKEGGKVVGTFRALRYSGGGAFGAYKGTCSILDRCAKTLAKDIARWLNTPSMNARLGDAK